MDHPVYIYLKQSKILSSRQKEILKKENVGYYSYFCVYQLLYQCMILLLTDTFRYPCAEMYTGHLADARRSLALFLFMMVSHSPRKVF